MSLAYSSDNLKTDSEVQNGLTAYDFALGIPIGKRDVYVALSYGAVSSQLKQSKTLTYSGTDLGLKLGGFLGRSRIFSSSLTYNLKSTVSFNDGTKTVELRGSSFKFDVGMNYWFSDTAGLGLRLYYYAPTLNEQVAQNKLTEVSYSRASLGQSLALTWNF